MAAAGLGQVREHFSRSAETLLAAAASDTLLASITAVADLCVASLRAGGKLLFAGNGGSAADAQHIAGEFIGRLNFDRRPLPALALTTDSSVLTAIANDYGYESVFDRQLGAIGRRGDVFFGISTSGRSPNVVRALAAGQRMGIHTVGFGGEDGGDMACHCDRLIAVPSRSTQMIQQVHIVAAHAICELVENAMCGRA
jgi:D-sedoheptulose 7-phosphate isomerase